ncbi:MAG TPA: hypothetical protein VF796_21900 [Humisphaera sp.]
MAKQSAKKILGMDNPLPGKRAPARATKANPDAAAGTGKAKRGRTAQTTNPVGPLPTHRSSQNELKTQANRPIGNGGGVQRGDRRDMHPLYSTGKNKTVGGKRGPIGASTRKGGTNDTGSPRMRGR